MRAVGTSQDNSFHGICNYCESEMVESRSSLKVERCPRKNCELGYAHCELAHAVCPICGGDFIMYPVTKKDEMDGNHC
jgi:hypothetical protein